MNEIRTVQRGARTKMNNMDWLIDVIEAMGTILTQDGIVSWLDKPVQDLNWATPLEAINAGRGADVLELANNYRISVW